jgi:predicted DNA-binding protein (MmcQ/YjbR family)
MSHPRMYSDDDPFLSEVREVCLALPEAVEVEAWGRPTFRAGKKIFATFIGSEEEEYGLILKPDPDDADALRQDDRFFAPKYWGPGGWLQLRLGAAAVDWEEVAELVEGSYRQVALKRMLTALDAT